MPDIAERFSCVFYVVLDHVPGVITKQAGQLPEGRRREATPKDWRILVPQPTRALLMMAKKPTHVRIARRKLPPKGWKLL